jgi:hypothetical protein
MITSQSCGGINKTVLNLSGDLNIGESTDTFRRFKMNRSAGGMTIEAVKLKKRVLQLCKIVGRKDRNTRNRGFVAPFEPQASS